MFYITFQKKKWYTKKWIYNKIYYYNIFFILIIYINMITNLLILEHYQTFNELFCSRNYIIISLSTIY